MTRAQQIERARLLRIGKTPGLSPFEYEDAGRRLRALEEQIDPTCVHCTKKASSHGQPICPVVVAFRKRAGKGAIPTEGQAADTRRRMAAKAAEAEEEARKKAAKESQRSLF